MNALNASLCAVCMQGAREEGPADLAKALEDAQVSWT